MAMEGMTGGISNFIFHTRRQWNGRGREGKVIQMAKNRGRKKLWEKNKQLYWNMPKINLEIKET
jgi:hypothetical protein